jgi:hypothetical protein
MGVQYTGASARFITEWARGLAVIQRWVRRGRECEGSVLSQGIPGVVARHLGMGAERGKLVPATFITNVLGQVDTYLRIRGDKDRSGSIKYCAVLGIGLSAQEYTATCMWTHC